MDLEELHEMAQELGDIPTDEHGTTANIWKCRLCAALVSYDDLEQHRRWHLVLNRG